MKEQDKVMDERLLKQKEEIYGKWEEMIEKAQNRMEARNKELITELGAVIVETMEEKAQKTNREMIRQIKETNRKIEEGAKETKTRLDIVAQGQIVALEQLRKEIREDQEARDRERTETLRREWKKREGAIVKAMERRVEEKMISAGIEKERDAVGRGLDRYHGIQDRDAKSRTAKEAERV